MSAAQHTPGQSSRRVTHTAAHARVICVRPRAVMPHDEWSAWFERRALMQGYTAVIDGVVIEPGTEEARAAIAHLSENRQHFSDATQAEGSAS